MKKILRGIGLGLAAVALGLMAVLFVVRGVNSLQFKIPDGIQERTYIKLGGIEQYVNIRGHSADNPVIIWLHGGPGWPDGFIQTTGFQQDFESDYTFMRWDQRGSGRTYYKSKTDPPTLEVLLDDLNDLVDYASHRFGQPIIMVGYSWGSVLGITYAKEYPEKITGFIGIGQVVDLAESDFLGAVLGAENARAMDDEKGAVKIEAMWQAYEEGNYADKSIPMDLFNITPKYNDPAKKDPTLAALVSPDFRWNDLRWQLMMMMGSNRHYIHREQLHLIHAMHDFTPPEQLEVPAVFITGNNDYITDAETVQKYQQRLNAPNTEMYIMPGLGHFPMFDDPVAFSEVLNKALEVIER